MKLIPLSKGRFAKCDDKFYLTLIQHKWSVDGSGYPQTMVKGKNGWRPVRMHRMILGLVGSEMADHVNGDKKDNRLENLRRCSHAENVRNKPKQSNNTSGYKGVWFNKKRDTYQAYITIDYRHKYLGSFDSPKLAAKRVYEGLCKWS